MRFFAYLKQEYQHRKKTSYQIIFFKKKKEEIESKVVRFLWEEVQKSFAVGVNDAGRRGRYGGREGIATNSPKNSKPFQLRAVFPMSSVHNSKRPYSSPKHLYSLHCTTTALFDKITKNFSLKSLMSDLTTY